MKTPKRPLPLRSAICLAISLVIIGGASGAPANDTNEFRGIQFIGFDRFNSFTQKFDAAADERVLTSPVIPSRIEWTELIASWNVVMTNDTGLRMEVRAFHGERPTKFFNLGLWASNSLKHLRESIPNQQDDDGDVATDTLVLKEPARGFQLRITFRGGPPWPELNFVGVSLLDPRVRAKSLLPDKSAWGSTLPVPERSQLHYDGGDAWCSPTTVSMLLGYWATKLNRPSLDIPPPAVAKEIHDPKWEGTGNWAFNMAFAGSLPGMRAVAVRLSDLSEVESWVAKGFPVGLSICSNRLNGRSRQPRGHLVVCLGFTEKGEPILNDPGRTREIRRVVSRERLVDAWDYSKNTVYLIYPDNARLPEDRFGHWDSSTSRTASDSEK